MTVAIFSALDEELALIRDSVRRLRSGPSGPWHTWTGLLGDSAVVLAAAGLGKVNAAALASLIWERHTPSLMVFSGVAGAIDPSIGVGDVVVGEHTIQHDAGVVSTNGLERYQAGHIPFYNPTDEFGYRPSHRVLEIMSAVVADTKLTPVLDRQPQVRFGTILTGDQFVNDDATRARLFADLGAQAVEMEGAALGQTAARLGSDHIVIRSVSDLAGVSAIEDFDRFLPEAAANSARLVLGLVNRLQQHDGDLTVGT